MKILYPLATFVLASFFAAAQDEGIIKKKSRITNDMGAYINLGPSFTLGKNIGDYSLGFNVEVGFMKRLNRLLSVGPAISYLNFEYDPEVTSAKGGDAYIGRGDPNN